jgi:hypothetical protein
VEPKVGGIRGETTLTLTGTGFAPNLNNNTVLVGGEPCRC